MLQVSAGEDRRGKRGLCVEAAGGMDKKQLPGFGNVEYLGADGFTVPSCSLPAWGDVKYR